MIITEMKTIVFAALFSILLAISAYAALEIIEIDIDVDYDEAYTYRVENRARISSVSGLTNNSRIDADVLPGSNVTFTVRITNTFSSLDLKNIIARITIKDIDDGADLEEESMEFDLEESDDARLETIFYVPLDVETGSYDVIIEAEAEDKNNTFYKTKIQMKMPVKKQSHDIRITDFSLNPSTVDCNRKVKLSAEIMNIGSNPESPIALEFNSAALGIKSIDRDIALESSEEASVEEKSYVKELNFEVPSYLRSKTYTVSINLYWKNFVLFDKKDLSLVVKPCIKETLPEIPTKPDSDNLAEPIKNETYPSYSAPVILYSPIVLFLVIGAIAVAIIFGYLVYAYSKK